MTYQIDYSSDTALQAGIPAAAEHPQPLIRYVDRPRQGIVIPNILKTSTAFVAGAAALISAEMWGPEWLQPSTPVAHYERRIQEEVKDAEMQVQAQYEPYIAQVKASAEQQVEQYKAELQLQQTYYAAGLDRAKFYAEQTARFQTQVAGMQMDRVRAEQAGEIGMVSLGRMFGQAANIFSPGAGDQAINWSQDRSDEMASELQRAAENGVRISVEGWNTDLPDPAMLQARIASIKPMQLPAPPVIRHRYSADGR